MALTVPVTEIVEKSSNPLLGKHESWGRVSLGEIATVQNGYAFKSAQFTKDNGTPLIRIRDVGKDQSETYYTGEYPEEYLVESGDLLIGMDGDFNCARWRGPSSLLNQRVCRIQVTSDLYNPKLLDYVLPNYLKEIHKVTSAVTVKHLSSKTIKEIPLPLPPFEQQKQIVEEIEKQFSRLDEAVANLKRVKANLKRYKASVLQAAVTGKLTEAWRKQNPDVEPARKLLKCILTKRRQTWEETELAKLRAKGKDPKNDKWKEKYKNPTEPDTSNLPELPDGWGWWSVGHVTGMITGNAFKKSEYSSSGVRLFQIANVSFGKIIWDKVAFLPSDYWDDYPELQLMEGDLLMALNRPLLGDNIKVGILGGVDVPAVLYQRVGKFVFADKHITKWMFYFLRSAFFINRLKSELRGVNIPFINQTRLMEYPFPICSPAERSQIVQEIESRLSVAEEIERTVETNLKRAERLRQSILKQAFSGKLV